MNARSAFHYAPLGSLDNVNHNEMQNSTTRSPYDIAIQLVLPQQGTRYPNIEVKRLHHDNSSKLVIGTKVLNVLVTSLQDSTVNGYHWEHPIQTDSTRHDIPPSMSHKRLWIGTRRVSTAHTTSSIHSTSFLN